MPAAISALGYLGIGKETSGYGTVATVTKYIPILSEDVAPTSGVILPDEIRGDRDRHRALEGDFTEEGDIEFLGGPEDGLGQMLLGALGTVETLGTQSPYTHIFKGWDTLPSYTAEINVGDVMRRRVLGCKVGVLTLSSSVGEPLTVTATLTGQTEDVSTTAFGTPSYATVRPFVGGDCTMTFGTTATTRAENIEISIDNSLIKDYKTLGGTRTVKELPPGRRVVSGTMDLGFEDAEVYQWFLGGATAPSTEGTTIRIMVEWTAGTISAGTSYYLGLELPKCRIRTDSAHISGADRVIEGVEFDAIYDSTSTASVIATLYNTESSY